MIASLHLLRRTFRGARQELRRLREEDGRDLAGSPFSRPIFPIELGAKPPSLDALGLFALWPDAAALDRFRHSPTARRWLATHQRLWLTLEPRRNRGTWPGVEDVGEDAAGEASGPILHLTYARPRPAKMPAFVYRNARVAQTLRRRHDPLWAAAFVGELRRRELGTISLWRDVGAVTGFAYGPGAHRDAVAAAARGRYFDQQWSARFAVTAAEGAWPGVDLDGCGAGDG